MNLSIDLSPAHAERLRAETERLGLSAEDLARAAIVDLLARYLTLAEVVDLHRRLLQVTGGAPGVRDLGALESAIAQPKATLGSADLYPTLAEKATALCLSLVSSHPFVDRNKRVAHAAMETFLVHNGAEIEAGIDEQERLMLELAAGRVDRGQLTNWLRSAFETTRVIPVRPTRSFTGGRRPSGAS